MRDTFSSDSHITRGSLVSACSGHQEVRRLVRRMALILTIVIFAPLNSLANAVSYSNPSTSLTNVASELKQYPHEFIITEMMMDAQGTMAAALALLYGPDPNSVLHFTSFVDSANRSYSFGTAPDSTYFGKPFSFSGNGGFSGGQWRFDGGGEFAGEPGDTHGNSINVPDEDSPDAGKSEWKIKFGGNELVFEADIEYYDPYPAIPNLFSLRSKGKFKLKGTDSTYSGTDVQNADGSWTWTLTDSSAAQGGIRVDSEGLRSDSGFGTFDVTLTPTPVPEPSSISLFATTALMLVVRRVRRPTSHRD